MDDVAQRLGRTFRVDTAQGSFILEMDDRCAAGWAGCRHPVRLRVLRVMDDADDLRDDVTGFPHLNGIADAEPNWRMKSSLWRSRGTVVPARKTGSKQAVGVK